MELAEVLKPVSNYSKLHFVFMAPSAFLSTFSIYFWPRDSATRGHFLKNSSQASRIIEQDDVIRKYQVAQIFSFYWYPSPLSRFPMTHLDML